MQCFPTKFKANVDLELKFQFVNLWKKIRTFRSNKCAPSPANRYAIDVFPGKPRPGPDHIWLPVPTIVLEIRNMSPPFKYLFFKRLMPARLGCGVCRTESEWEKKRECVTVAWRRVSLSVLRPCVSRMCAMSLRPPTSYSLLPPEPPEPPDPPLTFKSWHILVWVVQFILRSAARRRRLRSTPDVISEVYRCVFL